MSNWMYHGTMANYRQLYCVEPRAEDGSLDVRRIDGEFARNFPASGSTERSLVAYYFRHSGDARGSAPWGEIMDWFRKQGISVRPKYW
jgi:hypothetical protein